MAERDVWFYEIRSSTGLRFDPPRKWGDIVLDAVDGLSEQENEYVNRDVQHHGRVVRGVSGVGEIDMLSVNRVRMHDHPLEYSSGKEKPLKIGVKAGLSERTFVGFFPDNVVGILKGAEGPAPGTIKAYINRVVPDLKPKIRFQALFHTDTMSKVAQAAQDGIRLGVFKPKEGVNLAPLTTKSPRLKNIFERARQEFPGFEVTLTVKAIVDPQGRPPVVAADAFAELTAAADEHLEVFDVARMTFVKPNDERDSVNFIAEQLGMKQPVSFVGPKDRVISDESARKALKASYGKLKKDIKAALEMEATA